MLPEEHWFTEICVECGSALSFKIRDKLHEEQTPFQKIEVYETVEFGTLMVIDGFIMLTDRDNFIYHEMMSHTALFTHPDPGKVLIIGGGDCGTLREVLKHPKIELAHQVEIDERVTRLAEKYFPVLCESNDDPRAELHFTDGIKWVADQPSGSYDVIIIDSTDPVGQATRLFSAPFYADCCRILSREGILIAQSESPLIHQELIQSMRNHMRKAGFTHIGTLNFPQCCYPTGWWSATMASRMPLEEFRETDARDRPFSTHYYTHAIHRAAMAMPPFLKQALNEQEG